MDIDKAIDRLQQLGSMSDSLDMDKAALLSAVKAGKLHRERFGTFTAFVSHVGFSRAYAYSIIACYDNQAIRPHYQSLGAMRAQAIARATKVLSDSEIVRLIDYGRSHSASETLREVKRAKEAQSQPGNESSESNPDAPTLADVLSQQTALLVRKLQLEAELAQIAIRLAELAELARELSS